MRDFNLIFYTNNYSKTPVGIVDADPLNRHNKKGCRRSEADDMYTHFITAKRWKFLYVCDVKDTFRTVK
jgi:hypothetical protein